MPDKPAGKGLKKKIGPLPLWGWGAAGMGTFVVYRWWKGRQAVNAAGVSTALTGGTSIPPGGTVVTSAPTTTGSGASTGSGFTSYAQWLSAAIAQLTGQGVNGADALNGIQSWLNGSCVSQNIYNDIAGLITNPNVGLPPGWGTSIPTLSVCASSGATASGSGAPAGPAGPAGPPGPAGGLPPSGPPNLPASLAAAMTNNGEHLVSTQYDPVYNEWLYLTNRGGVYALNPQGGTSGTTFFGSIFNLPDNFANWVTSGGQQVRTASGLTVNADGSYTIVDTAGETYNFNRQEAQQLGLVKA